MLSRDILRYKELHSNMVYRREVGALTSARRGEERASEDVQAKEKLFWKEVARLSSAPLRSVGQIKGAVARPLERLISAHTTLLDAKRAHASARRDVQAGVVRVTQSDAMRGKVHELHLALKQRCAAILDARKEEELAELIARQPQLRRVAIEVAPQKMSVMEGAPPSMAGDRVPPSIMSAPCVPCGSTRTSGIAAVRSVEVQPLEDGPRLKVQCQLANGAPVTVSLSRHASGGVSAVVESPNVAVTASLARERANLLAKLGSLGVSLARLEVRRGGDSHINEGQQMRRPRWRGGEDDDENSIA